MSMQTKPVQAFRYVCPDDAHFLEKQSIKISAFQTYANLKVLQDKNEGKLRYSGDIHVQSGADVKSHAAIDTARRHNVYLAKSGAVEDIQLSIQNNNIADTCAVYCMACRSTNAYLEALGKTSVWEIPDVAALGRFVMNQFPTIFRGAIGRNVRYESKTVGLTSPKQASPFVKDPWYAPEEEYRLIWPTAANFREQIVCLASSSTPLIRRLR